MALGALIGAYQEDDSGGIRALLPLAGRTLVEYQARCAAAAGASPIVVLVERVPLALNDAFEHLRHEGISVIPVSDGIEAASRFEAGTSLLLIGDGVTPTVDLLTRVAQYEEPTVVTVPDDEGHGRFERIDGESRWAGVALIDSRLLGSTAAMLGDWDLPSTLLRRTLQDGALRVPSGEVGGDPLQVESAEDLTDFGRKLLVASRGGRDDWASRYVLPVAEELATERLMETRVKPEWLIWSALMLVLTAILSFLRGWPEVAVAMLVVSTPLDLIAKRLATLRLRPLPARLLSGQMLWPTAGLAMLALAWWQARLDGSWAVLAAAVSALAFAEAARIERGAGDVPGSVWLFSRRNAILAAVPFAIAGAWTALLIGLAIYAAGSFFFVQHWHHRIQVD